MRMTVRAAVMVGTVVVTAATLAPGAVAQQRVDSRATAIEEVIVTAQRREESLMDSPVAVTALSADSIHEQGITDTTGIADTVPNLSMTMLPGTPGSAGVFIRGLGQLDPQLTSDVKVGTYVDGVYMARMNNAAFDLVDVRRVEVLRGPQGTLYGRNTTGGALNVITRGPGGEFGFSERFSYGTRGYLRSVTRIDSPEFNDVSGSLTLLRREHDGTVENTATRPEAESMAGADETNGYRAALRWRPTERLTVDMSTTGIDSDRTAYGVQLSASGGFAAGRPNANQSRLGKIAMDFLEEDESETRYSNLNVEWDLGWGTFKSITGYADWEHSGFNDQDGGEYITPGGRLVIGLSTNDESQRQWTQEFQLLSTALDGRLDYLAGLFYFREKTKAVASAINGIVESATPTIRIHHTDYSSWAVYGQTTYRPVAFDSRLALTGGLRVTYDDKEADQRINVLGDTLLEGEDDWQNVTWTAIADYDWAEALSTYVKVSTGYNAGGFNLRDIGVDPNTGQNKFEQPFDEETLTTYEVGAKSEFFDKRVRLNAAAFYTEFEDMQVSLPFPFCAGGLFCTETRNAGEAEMDGLEVELTAIPWRGLTVEASYAYINAEVTELKDQSGADISGTTVFPMTPEHSSSLAVAYEFAPFSFGVLSARVDASFRDEVFFVSRSPNHDLYKGHDRTLVNARISLSQIPLPRGDLQVALWGKNLGDTEYRTMGIDFGVFQNNVYGELRSHGIDIVYNY